MRKQKKQQTLNVRISKAIWNLCNRKKKKLEVTKEWKEQLKNKIIDSICNRCKYCKKPITVGSFSIDHNIALSRNGTNELDNLDIIDLDCNLFKGNLTGKEFSKLVEFLKPFPEMEKILRTRLKMSGFVYNE